MWTGECEIETNRNYDDEKYLKPQYYYANNANAFLSANLLDLMQSLHCRHILIREPVCFFSVQRKIKYNKIPDKHRGGHIELN